MSRFHCTCVLLAVLSCAAGQARAQTAAPADSQGFIVFLGGNAIGREDVTTQRTPEGLTIEQPGATANRTPRAAWAKRAASAANSARARDSSSPYTELRLALMFTRCGAITAHPESHQTA